MTFCYGILGIGISDSILQRAIERVGEIAAGGFFLLILCGGG